MDFNVGLCKIIIGRSKFNSLTSIYDLDDYYILKAKTSDKCTPMAQNKKSHEMTTIALK